MNGGLPGFTGCSLKIKQQLANKMQFGVIQTRFRRLDVVAAVKKEMEHKLTSRHKH